MLTREGQGAGISVHCPSSYMPPKPELIRKAGVCFPVSLIEYMSVAGLWVHCALTRHGHE